MTAAPLHISEAVARKYLALAKQKSIHDPRESAEAIGYLISTMQSLLDSLEAEKSAPKPTAPIDPLLRLFVSDLADRLRKDATEQQHSGADYIHCHGQRAAADRIVEWTDQMMRTTDEYLAEGNAVKAVA